MMNTMRRIGIRSRAILRCYYDEEIEDTLLPSETYPSDHVAVVADLDIIEEFDSIDTRDR
jgi:hypothetical protein